MKNIALKQLNEHTPSTDEYIKVALRVMIKSSSKKQGRLKKLLLRKAVKRVIFRRGGRIEKSR